MPNPIHIFKPGRHTSTAGEAIEFSQADIETTARVYDPKLHEAPFVLGHPKTDDPAHGWAASLVATARGLFAHPRDVAPAFAESVNKREFAKVSSKFYRPTDPRNPVPGTWYLRHVGFLGAVPPAVKGLDDPAFADDDDYVTLEVAFGEADQAEPVTPAATETPAPKLEDTTVTPEEAARLEQENAELKAKLDAATAAQAKATADAIHEKNVAFAEGMAKEARIPADSVPLLTAALDFAQAPDAEGQVVEFGEGKDAKPMHEALRDFVKSLPPQVEFGEVATKDRAADAGSEDAVQYAEGSDPERIEADKKIRAHMKAHNVDYATAARAVMK